MKSMPSLTPHFQTIAKKILHSWERVILAARTSTIHHSNYITQGSVVRLENGAPFFLLSHTHFVFF
jgi:hypothetical protein